LFGEFWHKSEDEQNRIEHYKQYGYNTLVIWDAELSGDSEKAIMKFIDFDDRTRYYSL
jgi:hypothetical protein